MLSVSSASFSPLQLNWAALYDIVIPITKLQEIVKNEMTKKLTIKRKEV
jgi:hypothetical protein